MLGVTVEHVTRTGEMRIRHSSQQKPVTFNGRRKDASRAVVQFLRKVAAFLKHGKV
jgi:hypothetical protein